MLKKLLDKDHVDFPDQLKKIRKSLKLNTFNFSLRCQLSKTTVRRIENKMLKDHKKPCQKTWEMFEKNW